MNNLPETRSNVNSECGLCHYAFYLNTGRCTNYFCPNHEAEQHTRTLGQFIHVYAKPPLFHDRRWGNWRLDAERLCLVFEQDRWTYEVDIERINNSAQMLDWIYQVKQKGWASPTVLCDLLNSLHDLFNPQANLCSYGGDKKINATEFLKAKIAGTQVDDNDPVPISKVRFGFDVDLEDSPDKPPETLQ